MKTFALISLSALTLMTIGCGEIPAQDKKYGNHQLYEAKPFQTQNKKNTAEVIIMHTVMDPNTGKPSMYIPFPSSWKINGNAAAGQPVITGPNGLTVVMFEPQSFIYTNSAMTNQSFQDSGVQVMAPVGSERTMQQLIIPQGEQMGMTLLTQYPLPELAASDREYSAKLNGGDSPQNIFEAIGSEWKDGQGNKALAILNYNELGSYSSITWGYNVVVLKAQESGFEEAKKHYIYAMANKVYDQNAVLVFQRDLAATIKTQEDHATAMRNINSKGSAERLANDAATSKYVYDSNKAAAENRAHNHEVLQEQTNHVLTDISVVISPFDGKEYQVESGTKIYWINDEGKYIKSDDPLFDPNTYEDRIGVWKKAPMKKYE